MPLIPSKLRALMHPDIVRGTFLISTHLWNSCTVPSRSELGSGSYPPNELVTSADSGPLFKV